GAALEQHQAVDTVELRAIDEPEALTAGGRPLEVIERLTDTAVHLVVAIDLFRVPVLRLHHLAELLKALAGKGVLVEREEHLVEPALEEEEVAGPGVFLADQHGLAGVLAELLADDRDIP